MLPAEGSSRSSTGLAGTVVRAARANSPLKLLLPRNHGRGAWAYLASFGGGLVDGDSIHVDVERGRPAPRGCSPRSPPPRCTALRAAAGSCSRPSVGEDGLLVLLPDPVACFAGARYEQETSVTLAPGASLVLLDAFTCGRAARGERWAFSHYLVATLVQRAGVPLLLDSVRLSTRGGRPARRAWDASRRWPCSRCSAHRWRRSGRSC